MHKAYVEAMEKVEGEREEENGGSEEGSTASTASSLFARHFPKVRFFFFSLCEGARADAVVGCSGSSFSRCL